MASRQYFSMSTLVLALGFGCLTFAPRTMVAADMAQTKARPAPSIVVGANMLVSRDGDFPHMELAAAANPRNPKNLVGGAITAARGEGGFACRTYASTDGGSTWTASEFPNSSNSVAPTRQSASACTALPIFRRSHSLKTITGMCAAGSSFIAPRMAARHGRSRPISATPMITRS